MSRGPYHVMDMYAEWSLIHFQIVRKMNFDPLSRHYILKWSLVHFQIAAKMNFDPLLIFDAIIGTKVEQSSFWRQFESGPNFILNTWSENHPNICDASQVDQNSFGMHIQHVRRSPSHTLLDQNSYHRVYNKNCTNLLLKICRLSFFVLSLRQLWLLVRKMQLDLNFKLKVL